MSQGEGQREYAVLFSPAAVRDMEKLDKSMAVRMTDALASLAANPRPHGSIKLTNADGCHRLRVGDHRALYFIDDTAGTVRVARVLPRKDAY